MTKGPQNSPVSDPLPYQLPDIDGKKAPKKVKKSDWVKLRNSRKYKEVNEWIEVRKEYWRHFLPGGDELRKMAVTDPETAGKWAGLASIIVDELEEFQRIISLESGK